MFERLFSSFRESLADYRRQRALRVFYRALASAAERQGDTVSAEYWKQVAK